MVLTLLSVERLALGAWAGLAVCEYGPVVFPLILLGAFHLGGDGFGQTGELDGVGLAAVILDLLQRGLGQLGQDVLKVRRAEQLAGSSPLQGVVAKHCLQHSQALF